MWNEKATKPFLIVYLSFLFLATFFLIPTMTSFYYYDWGKHLDWSYFDGPPMIAYFFYISHAIFGTTFFSINIVGFICLTGGAYYIYKTGCLLQSQRTGLISALIWLALPTTTESIFIRVLYDAPLNLFTVMSFYYFARYSSLKRTIDLYLSALFTGAMILSKYTAAVSVLGMLLYIIFSEQRRLFKNVHFYLATLLILIMISPLLYWNTQHNWESITYLLNYHSQSKIHATTLHCLMELALGLILNYSVFLVLTLWGWIKYCKTKKSIYTTNTILEFTYALLFFALVFWFVTTLVGGDARVIYLTPLGLYIALASGSIITQYSYDRFFKTVYSLFLFLSIIMIIANSWPIASYLKKGITYKIITNPENQHQAINKELPVVTSYYTYTALFNFFMPNVPVYTLPCGDINQYKYWNASFLDDLSHGKIAKISFIELSNTKACAEQFFDKCEAVATWSHHEVIPVIHKSTQPVALYLYECSLPRIKVSG